MLDETRTEPLYVRVRPSIRAALAADASRQGQTLAVWVERAILAALPENPCENLRGE